MIKILKYLKLKFFWLTLERFPNLFRPGSIPYLSGDTLRNFSDHIFDEAKTFNPKLIKNGDVIFVNSEIVEIFFTTIHEKIESKYILITHNSDFCVNKKIASYADKKIIHWFAQNLETEPNKNISFIPIGLENRRRLKFGRKKWFKSIVPDKSASILLSFNEYNNFSERSGIKEVLNENPNIDSIKFDNTDDYFRNLAKYKFVICPEGNGPDTHRTWEALLLKTVPIFKISKFTKNLNNFKIPGIYLNNWEDLNKISNKELDEIYTEISKENISKYSYFSFWRNIIKKTKN